jgi:hypothetical protein
MFRVIFFSVCLMLGSNAVVAKTNRIILSVSSRSAVVSEVQLDDEHFAKIPQISMTVLTPCIPRHKPLKGHCCVMC